MSSGPTKWVPIPFSLNRAGWRRSEISPKDSPGFSTGRIEVERPDSQGRLLLNPNSSFVDAFGWGDSPIVCANPGSKPYDVNGHERDSFNRGHGKRCSAPAAHFAGAGHSAFHSSLRQGIGGTEVFGRTSRGRQGPARDCCDRFEAAR